MTREIKFRAWYGKGFFTDFLITSDGNYILECGDRYNRDEVELNQYTGLKDKNGVEIYEGDIIKDTYYRDNGWKDWKTEGIGIVKFNNGAFCLVEEESGKEMYDTIYNRLNPSDSKAVVSIEIIGNIYENKNLIDK